MCRAGLHKKSFVPSSFKNVSNLTLIIFLLLALFSDRLIVLISIVVGLKHMEPDLEGLLPTETSGLTTGERRRLTARHQNSASFSWTRTDVRYIQHSHDWLIRGFSQTDCRYLETSFSMKDVGYLLVTLISGLAVIYVSGVCRPNY